MCHCSAADAVTHDDGSYLGLLRRACRTAIPIQLMMLLLIGVASLVPMCENECVFNSLDPLLKYADGAPPLWDATGSSLTASFNATYYCKTNSYCSNQQQSESRHLDASSKMVENIHAQQIHFFFLYVVDLLWFLFLIHQDVVKRYVWEENTDLGTFHFLLGWKETLMNAWKRCVPKVCDRFQGILTGCAKLWGEFLGAIHPP